MQIKEKARNPIKDLAATARYWTLDRPTGQQTKTTAERDGLACAFGRMTCCGRACCEDIATTSTRASTTSPDTFRALDRYPLRFCGFCKPDARRLRRTVALRTAPNDANEGLVTITNIALAIWRGHCFRIRFAASYPASGLRTPSRQTPGQRRGLSCPTSTGISQPPGPATGPR